MTSPLDECERTFETATLEWQGITVGVSYEPDWLGSGARGSIFPIAHLEIRSIRPEKAVLPMTETGYRSHFLGQGIVEDAGGPGTYVRAWLDHAAKSPAWRKQQAATRQLDLFG